jgi:hypothetical protein
MDDPEISNDEAVLLTTPDVFIKSIPFEAILTDERIILFDRKKGMIPQKDIPLETIRDVEAGENAVREPVLNISILTGEGDTRQLILTFPPYGGKGRSRDRDAWSTMLRKLVGTTARGEGTAADRGAGARTPVQSSRGNAGITERLLSRKEVRGTAPIETIAKREAVPPKPAGPAPLPYGSFCSQCGNRLAKGAIFCSRCGANVTHPEQDAPAPRREEPEGTGVSRSRTAPPPDGDRAPVRKSPRALGVEQAQTAEKTSLFSRLFQKKRPQQKPVPRPEAPPPQRQPAKGAGSGSRKNLITMAALIVVVLLVVAGGAFVYFAFFQSVPSEPGASPDTTAAPTATTTKAATATTPAIAIVHTEATPVIIPSDGVYVRISYLGAWRGSYGITGALVSAARSGDVSLKVENATGTVQASFRKDDASTRPHELVVEIYRNGALIKRGVTTEPKGQVDISVNIATATPITVAATATVTAVVT